MKQAAKLAYVLLLLLGAVPALAGNDVLLLGCAEDPEGGSTVVLAESSEPIVLDGTLVLADDLLGQRCAAVLRRLLDNELVTTADIADSGHLVLTAPKRDDSARDGDDDVCCPDCLIWDYDTAGAYVQLTCDLLGSMTIVGQDSAASASAPGLLRDYVGRPCVEALAALGGLANLVRSSVAPAPRDQSTKRRRATPRVSVLTYQLALKQPSPQ